MHIIDSGELLPGAVLEADLCIVGTGPAGLTIARELAGLSRRFRIVMLESGGLHPDPWADALGGIESVGAPRVMDQTLVRNRILGGTSSTWSGRAAVFDDTDFARRDWVPGSGWPIARDEVARFFARSADHLGLGVDDNTARGATAVVPAAFRALDADRLRGYVWSYSRDASDRSDFMRFGPRAVAEGLGDIRVVTHATVTTVQTDAAASAITGVEVSDRAGGRFRVVAPMVVLSAGAIENARLLLASDQVVPGGVGNRNDLVGRYLMDHPRGPVAHFQPGDHLAAQRLFRGRRLDVGRGRATATIGLALSPELQRREGLLNCAAWAARTVSDADPFVALGALARRDGSPVGRAKQVLRGAGLLAEGALGVIGGRSPLRRVDELTLECMVEQRPDRDSRIMLADSRDALGVRRSRIDWRISEQEALTVQRMRETVVAELGRLGLPVPRLSADVV
ncbi:MAG: hypothetical protein RI885_256, partial [Actinomycetota bacterium]